MLCISISLDRSTISSNNQSVANSLIKREAAHRAASLFISELLLIADYLRRFVFLSIPELGKLLYFFLLLPTGEPMRIIAQRNPMLD